jgi:hypothetical protein
MNRFYEKIFVAICGLMMLYGFGIEISAAGSCLTEVVSKDIEVYTVFTNMTLDYQMKQGEELEAIPKEYLNDQCNTLAKNFEITLPSGKAKGNHILKKPMEVQKQNGQRYRLRENTDFRYILPVTKSGYKVTIPSGTSVTKKEDTTPEKYALAEDIAINITPSKNSRVKLTVAAQRVVERIPGTSGMGTTLEFEPKRAPVGEYITLDVSKSDFDFQKAQFYVCIRKQEKGEENNNPFITSNNVELKNIQINKAKLQARIPDINESGVHLAKSVDLMVVARGPDGEIAEVVSQDFAVSSRTLAVICWFSALVLPWLVSGIIAGRKETEEWFRFDPIWYVSGKYGGASLSLAQILLWTVLIFSASFYVLVVSGRLLDLTNDVLILLGITGGSSIIAKITASARESKGREIAAMDTKDPKWLDLFQTEGRPDLYKVQMALFTTLAAVFVTSKIYWTLEFPELPAGLLTLIGISNGVYLGAKATSKTIFEKLAEKSSELQQAREELEKRKAEADQSGKRQQEAENEKTAANKTRDATKDKLGKEQDASPNVMLKELFEQQNAGAKEAERYFKEAEQKKSEADHAKNVAEGRVKELEDEFEKLKAEALKQV